MHNHMERVHQSVLFSECLEALALNDNDVVVDATVGGAGHFMALFERLGPEGVLIGIDADKDAIARAEAALAGKNGPTVHLVNDDFRNLEAILASLGIKQIDKALFDLGWSSYHLQSGRGFSFREDEPLLMTYGEPKAGDTAADIVNDSTEEELTDLLYSLGEERFARRIAAAIVAKRSLAPITTTGELVAAVKEGTPAWYQTRRTHPATKTFQALRIAVNGELSAVREGILASMNHMTEHGRIAVITFHSIEDRIVKGLLRDAVHQGRGSLVNKKPIIPTPEELTRNPRARSAKLRVFESGGHYRPSSVIPSSVNAYA